jgi:hypothetical protein
MQFDNVKAIDRQSAEMAFASGNESEICHALVSLAFHEPDWLWAQNQCLFFLEKDNQNIAGVAATCLGHLARIHRKIEKDKVTVALKLHLSNGDLAGIVEDALDDILMFT